MIAKSVCFNLRNFTGVFMRHCSTDNMSIKFSANLTMMFCEEPTMTERYDAAKAAGFKYVETAYPYFEPVGPMRDAKEKSGLEQVLINAWAGNVAAMVCRYAILMYR
jgi:hydroxypyruvate isomerase